MKMQRVPQMRMFWSSDSSSKRSVYKIEKLPYTQNTNYNTLHENGKLNSHKQTNFETNYSTIQSNARKPFSTNYYANAVRICQQNSLKLQDHSTTDLTAPYIVKRCRRPFKYQFDQSGIKKIINKATETVEQISKNHVSTKLNNTLSSQSPHHPVSLTGNPIKVNFITGFAGIQTESLNSLQQGPYQNGVVSKVVQNQYLLTLEQYPKKMNQNFVFSEGITQRQPQINQPNVYLNDQKEFQTKTKNETVKKKKSFQSIVIPEVSKLISQLGQDDKQDSKAHLMIQELEENVRKQMQRRRNCLRQLDRIIQRYEASERFYSQKSGFESELKQNSLGTCMGLNSSKKNKTLR